MRKIISACLLLASSLLASAGKAGPVEDTIGRALQPRVGSLIPADKITKSPYAGLYEVDTPRGLVYTDAKGSFLLVNSLFIDTQSGRNLTDDRLQKLGAFKFSELPLADAIKTVRGNGSRVLVTVEDPNCGYCKKLTSELAKIDNVTIYTFLYPILAADSVEKSKAVWCAPNRSQAWLDFMIGSKPLLGKTDCENPIDRNVALAQRLRIMGTPAVLFQSGERLPGFIPAEQIEQRLARKN
jgi:thiol:disulfide interchange protein DsbC